MKIDEIRWNPWKSSQGAQIQPCSLLLARIQGSNLLSCRAAHAFLKLPAFSPETSQIHEIHEILWKSMKFDGIHENQPRELRSSLAPCSLLGFRDPTFFLVGAAGWVLKLPALSPETSQIHEIHEILWKSMKFDGIHGNQPHELRTSLAPCSLLGYRIPTSLLVSPPG